MSIYVLKMTNNRYIEESWRSRRSKVILCMNLSQIKLYLEWTLYTMQDEYILLILLD